MTKSEKSALEDIVGMFNAILIGNSDGDQPAKQVNEEASSVDNSPSQKELDFVRKLRELTNDGKTIIRGFTINPTTETVIRIGISSDCLSRLLKAYLEKYDHE